MIAPTFVRSKRSFLFCASPYLVAVTFLPLFAAVASAQTKYWISPTSGFWYQGSNWFGGNAPIPINDVTIGNGGSSTINGAASSPTVNNLYVGNGGTGSLTITDPSNDYTRLTTSSAYIGYSGGNGSVLLNRTNASWTSGQYFVGHSATGIVSVSGGAKVNPTAAHFTYLGYTANVQGTIEISGTGSSWGASVNGNSEIHVGEYGKGLLNVSNGGSAISGYITLGKFVGAQGTATIADVGSSIQSSSLLQIGEAGTGSLTISNGGRLQSAHALIGAQQSSSGLVLIKGTESLWLNSSELRIGEYGDGTLHVSSGGGAKADRITLGAASGSMGYLSVIDSNSKAESSASLTVGQSGQGTLTVANGGTVNTANLSMARFAGSTGILNIGEYDGSSTAGTITTTYIEFGEGAGTINFNQSDAVVFTTSISGRGKLEQRGSGTTTLAGTQDYGGQTIVSNGTLLLDGSLASSENKVIVGENGTLGGHGSVIGTSSVSGTLAPGFNEQGRNTGRMTFNGDLTVDEFSSVVMEIGGNWQDLYDKICVEGSFSVSENARLNIVLINGYTPMMGDSFTLFAGTFPFWNVGEIDLPVLSTGLSWDVSRLASAGQLGVIPEPSSIGLCLLAVLFGGHFVRRRMAA